MSLFCPRWEVEARKLVAIQEAVTFEVDATEVSLKVRV